MKDILISRVIRKAAISYPSVFPFFYWPQKLSNENNIYLTFDDGPAPKITEEILSLLKHNNIKATFFVGRKALKYLTICKEILSEGHSIGSHSRNHKCLPKLTHPDFIEETIRFNDILSSSLGVNISLFRPPFGFLNIRQIASLHRHKIKIVLWTIDSLDYFPSDNLEKKANDIVSKICPGDILLIHDTLEANVQYSRLLIEMIFEKGFTFKQIN